MIETSAQTLSPNINATVTHEAPDFRSNLIYPESNQPTQIKPLERLRDADLEQLRLLDKTGFSLAKQLRRFTLDYQTALLSGHSYQEAVSLALVAPRQDLINFKLEYLLQGLVLPISLKEQKIAGRNRIVGGLYNSCPLLDMISSDERGGAVKDTIAKMEIILLKAPVGSVAIMTSPPGRSGMRTDDGRSIDFVDTQSTVWIKKEDGYEGVNIVTDMDEGQNREFLIALGAKRDQFVDSKYQSDRAANIVRNAIFLDGQGEIKNVEDVVSVMKRIKKSLFAHKVRGKTFDDVFQQLKVRDKLLDLDENSNIVLETFESGIKSTGSTIAQELLVIDGLDLANIDLENLVLLAPSLMGVVKQMNKAVLNLSMLARGKTLHQVHYAITQDYQKEVGVVQQYGGCNGGGVSLANPLAPRTIEIGNCEEIKCGKKGCGWKANESEAQQVVEGKLTHCPRCGWKPGEPKE